MNIWIHKELRTIAKRKTEIFSQIPFVLFYLLSFFFFIILYTVPRREERRPGRQGALTVSKRLHPIFWDYKRNDGNSVSMFNLLSCVETGVRLPNGLLCLQFAFQFDPDFKKVFWHVITSNKNLKIRVHEDSVSNKHLSLIFFLFMGLLTVYLNFTIWS